MSLLFDICPSTYRLITSHTPDGKSFDAKFYTGLVVGAVDEFVSGCKPFKDKVEHNRCATIYYWGGITPLALSVPLLWTGMPSPLTDLKTFNQNSDRIRLKTHDASMLVDGDYLDWEGNDVYPERTFTFTRGPEIQLLHAA